MKFDTSTPRAEVTIQGVVLTVPTPFKSGHSCNEGDADTLNQTLTENIRNNMAKRIEEAQGEGKGESELQALVDEYVAEYEFGIRRGGGARTVDPVEREALEIARKNVRDAIARKGLKLKDFSASRITELAEQSLAKHPEWREAAKLVVEARSEAATKELDLPDVAA